MSDWVATILKLGLSSLHVSLCNITDSEFLKQMHSLNSMKIDCNTTLESESYSKIKCSEDK